MYCSKCGKHNPDHASFCTKCGAALSGPSASFAEGDDGFLATAPPHLGAGTVVSSTGFDEEAWRAVIGPRASYYLPRFKAQHTTGERSRWNWPAVFFTFYWLLFRKQWVAAVACFLIPWVITFAVSIVGATLGKDGSVIVGLLWLSSMGVLLLGWPVAANSLYYKHCRNLIEQERTETRSRERFLARLEAKGGTSPLVLILVGVVGFVFVVGILAAVAIPAYQEYTQRAKSAEAIASGMVVARAVGDQYQRTGQLPTSLEPLLAENPRNRYVAGMQMRQNGVIEMTITFGPNTSGGGIVHFTPAQEGSGPVTWTCAASPEMQRKVPMSCRKQ